MNDTLAILATTIAGFVFTWLVSGRRRKWDLEDAERKAISLEQKVAATAAEVKATQIQAADTLAAKVEHSAVNVRHDLTSATERIVQAADRAYTSANSLNEKIASVTAATNEQFNALLDAATTSKQLGKIDETTTEIDQKVTDIHRGLELEEIGQKDRVSRE